LKALFFVLLVPFFIKRNFRDSEAFVNYVHLSNHDLGTELCLQVHVTLKYPLCVEIQQQSHTQIPAYFSINVHMVLQNLFKNR